MSDWTDERIEKLTKLWNEGRSCTQIAKALTGVSRNAVIGKVHRLGLHGRSAAIVEEALRLGHRFAEHRPAKVRPLVQHRTHSARDFAPGGKELSLKPPTIPQPAAPGEFTPLATITGLHSHACKWPIGDPLTPSFGYCGRLKDLEASYCDHHKRIAFVAPKPRTAAQKAGDAKRAATFRARGVQHRRAA